MKNSLVITLMMITWMLISTSQVESLCPKLTPSVTKKMKECATPQLPEATSQFSINDLSCKTQCEHESVCEMFYFNQSSRQCVMSKVPTILITSSVGCDIILTVNIKIQYVQRFEAIKKYVKNEVDSCFLQNHERRFSNHTVPNIEECINKCELSSCQIFSFNMGTSICMTGNVLDTQYITFCACKSTNQMEKVYLKSSSVVNLQSCSEIFIEKEITTCFFDSKENSATHQETSFEECGQICKSSECEIFSFSSENLICEIGRMPQLSFCDSCSSHQITKKIFMEYDKINYCSKSCREIKQNVPSATSGIYNLTVTGNRMTVFCDMETEDEQWIVIQRRQDGSQPFDKTWIEYKNGFGDLKREFWLGNDNLYKLTTVGATKIRFDLWDMNDVHKYAEYSVFAVAHESDNYRLTISGYDVTGTAGESMSPTNNMLFSTKDKDNDQKATSCSQEYGNGGWWFSACFEANLNGQYFGSVALQRIVWYKFNNRHEGLKISIMKISY